MANGYVVFEENGKKARKSVITYLEVSISPPETSELPRIDLNEISIVKCENITVSFYRYLYNTVGELWMWKDRRALNDEALVKLIHKTGLEVYILWVRGCPAGYFELDIGSQPNVELVYFGLIPEFFGLNLGTWFLNYIVRFALSRPGFTRLWVHTCSLDHPKAMSVYQSQGFTSYGQETVMEEIPEWYMPILERAVSTQKSSQKNP